MPGIRSASASDVDAFTEVFLECWRVSRTIPGGHFLVDEAPSRSCA
jgi:hypothetical protein